MSASSVASSTSGQPRGYNRLDADDHKVASADDAAARADLGDCAICFESLDDTTQKVIGVCSHIFCSVCIQGWLAQPENKSCPTCRAKWKVSLVTTSGSTNQLVREYITLVQKQKAKTDAAKAAKVTAEARLQELQGEIARLRQSALSVAAKKKKPLGYPLSNLTEAEILEISKQMWKGDLSCNLQTFIRALYGKENATSKAGKAEIDEIWDFFFKKARSCREVSERTVLMRDVLVCLSERCSITLEQLSHQAHIFGCWEAKKHIKLILSNRARECEGGAAADS